MKAIFPKMIVAESPMKLSAAVQQKLTEGFDLYAPTFVGHAQQLCQWMIPSLVMYEYILIHAESVEALEAEAGGLAQVGFDFIFNTVMWNGQYLQWMCRMNEKGLVLREAAQELAADQAADLKMVVAAQPVLRLAPYPVCVIAS